MTRFLATALYQSLPVSTDPEMENLPGQGRKLLALSDSWQDAAFFAPYLERTYQQILCRRDMLEERTNGELRYRFQIDLVRMWIEKNKPLSRVLIEEGL